MENSHAEHLWGFFAEYYDDWITHGQTGSLVINARTVRVLSRMYGRDTVQRSLRAWVDKGDIHIFGDFDDLNADAPCVELRGYPSHVVDADGSVVTVKSITVKQQ
jgi:hypothetical protein